MRHETLQLDGLTFEVRRSTRRQTLGIIVDRGANLVLQVPKGIEIADVERRVRGKLMWVHQKLAEKERMAPEQSRPAFVSGESFTYLGRNYRLRFMHRQDASLRIDGGWFLLREEDRPQAADAFKAWFVEAGSIWLEERVKSLSPRTGLRPERLEVRDLGYRWGSCGRRGVLYFNWRLMQLPVRLVDYVVLHELTHLLEPHHGPKFWARLERALPDYRERRNELSCAPKEFLQFPLTTKSGRRRKREASK